MPDGLLAHICRSAQGGTVARMKRLRLAIVGLACGFSAACGSDALFLGSTRPDRQVPGAYGRADDFLACVSGGATPEQVNGRLFERMALPRWKVAWARIYWRGSCRCRGDLTASPSSSSPPPKVAPSGRSSDPGGTRRRDGPTILGGLPIAPITTAPAHWVCAVSGWAGYGNRSSHRSLLAGGSWRWSRGRHALMTPAVLTQGARRPSGARGSDCFADRASPMRRRRLVSAVGRPHHRERIERRSF